MTDNDQFRALSPLAKRFEDWLLDHALPLWANNGIDRESGGFYDLLDLAGEPITGPKRGRVLGRQIWAFALARSMGWKGDWINPVRSGLQFALSHRREDGQLPALFASDSRVLSETATLYDQTFFLLALSEARKHFPEWQDLDEAAYLIIRSALVARRNSAGGYVESADHAFQSNPHMHLLEAMLAWQDTDPGGPWGRTADEVADLCLTRLIDKNGAIREFYDAQWRSLSGEPGRCVEPGHQFEWAWLLGRWARFHGNVDAGRAARRLFEIGSYGMDWNRGVAIDELDDEFRPVRSTARLWPQTERLKAALALMTASKGEDASYYCTQAVSAANTVWLYLETARSGLWYDRMLVDGSFIEEPSPASSFYHLICAINVMKQAVGALR